MLQLHCICARVCIFIFMGVVLYAMYYEKLISNRVGMLLVIGGPGPTVSQQMV